MFRLLSRDEVDRLFAPFRAEFQGIEAACGWWRTPSGYEVCLFPDDRGLFDEFAVLQALTSSLEQNCLRYD